MSIKHLSSIRRMLAVIHQVFIYKVASRLSRLLGEGGKEVNRWKKLITERKKEGKQKKHKKRARVRRRDCF